MGRGRPRSKTLQTPEFRYAVVQRQLKHEDVFFVLDGLRDGGEDGDADGDWKVFCVADGHGGQRCANFVKENLGPTLSRLLPSVDSVPPLDSPEGEEFAEAVRRAMVEAFISINADFELEGCRASGTTVSVALVRDWLLTVANVGDSEVFLDTRHQIIEMSCCHKLNDNEPEQHRLRLAGVKVATLCRSKRGPPADGESGIGPLRAWPGGIAMSRSLGDMDCGPHVLPVPHIRQVMLPRSGARIILASDGLWDHVSGVKACKYSRSSMLKHAPKRLINLAASIAGRLSDDTTILTVDVVPQSSRDFSDTRDSVASQVFRGVRNLVRRTMLRGRRFWIGAKSMCSYYADVDGMKEYPEVLQNDYSTPSTPPSPPPVSGTSRRWRSKSGSKEPKSSASDGWDLCSSPWNYSFVEGDITVTTRLNAPEEENWKIMDSAQFYADDTFGHSTRKGPGPQSLLGVAIEEDDSSACTNDLYEEEF